MAEMAGKTRTTCNTGWDKLGRTVVIRAVQDYRRLKRRRRKQPQNVEIQKELRLIEEFFCTSQISMFTPIDGRWLFDLLNREDDESKGRRVFMLYGSA